MPFFLRKKIELTIAFSLQGRARGRTVALVIRAKLQGILFRLGCWIQHHSSFSILAGLVLLTVFAIGLPVHAKMETDAEKLWVEGTRDLI